MIYEINKKIILYSCILFSTITFLLSIFWASKNLYDVSSLSLTMSVLFLISSIIVYKNNPMIGFYLSISVMTIVLFIIFPFYRNSVYTAKENFIGALLLANFSTILIIYCGLIVKTRITIIYGLVLLVLNLISIKIAGQAFQPIQTGIPITIGVGVLSTLLVVIFKSLRDYSENELKIEAGNAKAANAIKSSFLANMSHEIRTPMNGVLGMANLLLEENLTEAQRQKVSILTRSAESLLTIINDILDLSKIESGKLEIDSRPFQLGELFSDLRNSFAGSALEKGLELKIPHLDEIDFSFIGDEIRIRQILINLIGNALKFTNMGIVELKWSYQDINENDCKIFFEIIDTGIGMVPDQISRMFQRFSQGDSSTTRKYGGTGLGLSISKELVVLMGGDMNIVSELGVGSTFSLNIILKKGHPFMEKLNPNVAIVASMHKVIPQFNGTALIVDDNTINQLVITGLLRKMNIKSKSVSSGIEALDILKKESFEIVFMDIQMAEMDGYQTTREIRSMQRDGSLHQLNIFIVALTANAMSTDRQKCLSAGMDDFLSKPIEKKSLIAVLEKFLK